MSSIVVKKLLLVRYPRVWAACSVLLWSFEKTLVFASWIVSLVQTALSIVDFSLATLSAIGSVFSCIWNAIWASLTLGAQALTGLARAAQAVQASPIALWKKFPTWVKCVILLAILWLVLVRLELLYWKIWFLVQKPYFIKASNAFSYILNSYLELLWNTLSFPITLYDFYLEFDLYSIPYYCVESMAVNTKLLQPIVTTHQTIVKWLCDRAYWFTQQVRDLGVEGSNNISEFATKSPSVVLLVTLR